MTGVRPRHKSNRPADEPIHTSPTGMDFDKRSLYIAPKSIKAHMIADGALDYGLSFYAQVTTYTDTTHFKAAGLAGKGAGFFIPTAGAPYEIYVVQADAAAPEGQMTPAVAYTTADGTFQHAAFSGGNLAVGDIVLIIHPLLASLGTKATAAATGAVTTTDFLMAYIKQIVTGLALDGSAPHSYDYTKATVPGWLHGFHMIRRILFVIPEAIGSITAHNTAIKAELDKMALVETITQVDALTYPDYESITLTVLGSPLAGTAWTTSNLAHIKAIFGLPVVCVDAIAAAYLKMGTDGGNAASKTVLNAIANIEASILGMGIDDTAGLAAGANTVAAAGVTFSTLDMSDADITEVWYAYESVNANTDVLLAEIRKTMPDGTPGVDLDGAEVPGTLAFYGCAYSMGSLNTLGQAVLHLLVEKLLHSSTAGLAVLLSGNVGNVVATIGTKSTPAATGAVSNAKQMMAYVKQLVTALILVLADTGELQTDWADGGRLDLLIDAIETDTDPKVMGRLQIATTTEDLNQVAGTYDLFTGTDQAVVLEKLNVKMPTGAAGGAVTSIAIATDDATVGTIIGATDGAVANLTSEADLGWTGTLLINVGTKIRLTIAGGAHGSEYLTTVIAQYRAVVSGGYLA